MPSTARLRVAHSAVLVLKGGRWALRGARVGFVSEHRDLVTFFVQQRVQQVFRIGYSLLSAFTAA